VARTAILLVFLKYPRAGAVKTRLAASIGPRRAAALYRGWITLVLTRLQPLRERVRMVGYFDGAACEAFAPWLALADEWWAQPEGDLGERLRAGFAAAHAAGGPVVAVGTDCLELDASLVLAALDALEGHDAVFGPALDGGYYLVGTARELPGFFRDIPWSSPSTLSAHLSRCAANGWSVGLLPARGDIDTADDWREHRRGRRSPA
jgi:rSAM/selenodomain-associated transferase 1